MTARPNTQAAHARARMPEALSTYGAEAVAGIYAGSVLFAPWLGGAALALAAVTSGGLVAWNIRDRWRPRLALAAWAPAHLLVMAAGGPVGPALPLLAAWSALLAYTERTRRAAVGAGLATLLVLVVAAWAGHLSMGGGVETLLVMASGGVLGGVGRQLASGMEGKARRLERILDDAHAGQNDVLSAAVRRSEELGERGSAALGVGRDAAPAVGCSARLGPAGHARRRRLRAGWVGALRASHRGMAARRGRCVPGVPPGRRALPARSDASAGP
ncbi:MAG: hypothetical protein P8Z36_13355 [Gemmatimonadota bacterium]